MKPSDIFSCKKCGDCCKGYGGTFVTHREIEAIAGYINADVDRFIDEKCQMSGDRPVLAQGNNGYCIFWDEACTIHPVKPRMCRAWPFIESVLIDVNNWQIMAASCPGIRIDVADRVVMECVNKELSKR
jgi:Fe-S-cluster containining protein